jgi:diacylglycerol kinase (ATP)
LSDPVSTPFAHGAPASKFQEGKPVKPRLAHIIINPAAGQEQPLLGILNRVFKEHGVDWEVFITKDAGDARRFARESAEAGVDVVIACGGDGTVTEVAGGLRGTGVPLGILPCGTANVMSLSLNIPTELESAVTLIATGQNVLRALDMGMFNDTEFMLRATVGLGARVINNTPRESKNRWGTLAYMLSAINELNNVEPARYILNLDGMHVEVDGITAFVGNSMNPGVAGLSIVPGVDMSDGLIDFVLIRRSDLPSLLAVLTNTVFNRDTEPEPVLHWQAKKIEVFAEPEQPTEIDGEEFAPTPFTVQVLPRAALVICPPPPEETT